MTAEKLGFSEGSPLTMAQQLRVSAVLGDVHLTMEPDVAREVAQNLERAGNLDRLKAAIMSEAHRANKAERAARVIQGRFLIILAVCILAEVAFGPVLAGFWGAP